jgi:hypothetical protein
MPYFAGDYRLKAECPAISLALTALVVLLFVSCNKSENSQATQKTFASPAEAGAAFLEGAKSGDQSALVAIFGPDVKDVLFSGDTVKDQNALQDFVAAYGQMNRWREIKPGGEILYVGADNYPFPIPLGQNSSRRWYFDTAAGKDEILARRIGKGELTAIAACGVLVDAQQQYFSQRHGGDNVKQYAQKIGSDEGKQNGLYWPASEGQTQSPLNDLGDFAKTVGYRRQAAAVQWLLLQDIDEARRQSTPRRQGLHRRRKDDRWVRYSRVSSRLQEVGNHDVHGQQGRYRLPEGLGRKDSGRGPSHDGVQPWGRLERRQRDGGSKELRARGNCHFFQLLKMNNDSRLDSRDLRKARRRSRPWRKTSRSSVPVSRAAV